MPEYPYFSAPQTLPIQRQGGMYGNGPGHAPHPGGQVMLNNPGIAPSAAYAGAYPYGGYNPNLAAQQQQQQPQAPAAQPRQQVPAQVGSMYYPNPYQGYYPNTGYYPGAARR
jgi:hypothetical protein